RFVLPIVCAVGIFNPILDRTPAFPLGSFVVTTGMISMITLLMKGIFCLMASFLLVASTRIEAICAVLRRIHVPSMLVTLLLLTYRYAAVLAEEANVMTQAYSLRAPGQKGIHYKAWGSFLGQLLLRSMDRAEELYSSMMLRGYHGELYYAQRDGSSAGDVLYAVLWCALFIAARFVNLTQLLGTSVMR
ncbi:MAG: energy-coupling factor transporter transmembrane component T, partial [Lachnospiraceae bacterium]